MLLALVLAGSCACWTGCGTAETSRPRNLLFLCVDTLRADHLGVYGGGAGASPAIDELAAGAVVFENAVSHASWTLPSFAAVLTSTYTSTNGCWTKEDRLKGSLTTLPEIFQAAGFETYGVASHVFFREAFGLQQGFDAFDAELASTRDEEGWRPLSSPYVTQKAIEFLEARGPDDRPFLLWLHYFDPHMPYVDHAGVGDGPEHEHARYRSEITYTDGHVGRVLEALDRGGFREDTVVVFLSDHGEAWEEHAGVRRHAKSLFGEELTVPLVLRVPGVPERRVTDPVRTVDLMPTLLGLFGLRAPSAQPMEGQSLLPLLHGASWQAAPLLAEIELHPDQVHRRALVDEGWKLVERQDGTYLLFDLARDPGERNDRAGSERERVERMASKLLALLERARSVGERFQGDEPVVLSEEDLALLRQLGY